MKQKIRLSFLTGTALFMIPFASQATIQNGFFVGGAANIAAMDYGYKDDNYVSIKKGNDSVLLRPDLHVGYGSLLSSNNIYAGFEVGVQLKNSKMTEVGYYNSPDIATNNAGQGMTYYADFMPGLVFNDQKSVFYVVAGASDSSFTFQQENNGTTNFSMTESHFGYRFGAGYLYALTDSFSMNAKIVYSNFGSIQFDYGPRDNYTLNPEDAELTLGINYTFGGDNATTQSPFLGD